MTVKKRILGTTALQLQTCSTLRVRSRLARIMTLVIGTILEDGNTDRNSYGGIHRVSEPYLEVE
jgi:hypothetical protein